MPIAQSKLTAQGQISIPAEVRRKLGVGPGSVVEWDERDDEIVVRRAGKHTSSAVHAALFATVQPTPRASVKDAVRAYMRKKHARRRYDCPGTSPGAR
ncbi:MAG: AbrB/MazE/SpoVT family DNA-binding domain-containing protein [Burkholderiales bacterium]|nr:AbrB/MazE/SpoVT family DNA-binding domain-containing protein [Burkholderiales bacterium]